MLKDSDVWSKKILKALIFFPPVFMALYLIAFGVNVPYGDEWATPAEALIDLANNNLTIESLFQQHNESRKFFPRIIFIMLAQVGSWNVKQQMFLSLVVATLTYYSTYQIIRYATGLRMPPVKWLGLFGIGLMIFSPMQYENWLWGIQVITFVPASVVTLCSALAYSRQNSYVKFISSALLCCVATFTFANGLISWLIVLPILAWFEYQNSKKLADTVVFIGSWAAAFFLNVYLYFKDYVKPEYHPSYAEAFEQPIQTIAYFLSFLGSALSPWSPGEGIIPRILLAIFFVLLYSVFTVASLCNSSRLTEAISRTIAWHTIAAYAVASAAITSLGRVGFGVGQSTAPRYVTFSTYFYVGLIGLMITVLSLSQTGSRSPTLFSFQSSRWLKRWAIVSLILFSIFYPLSFAKSVQASSYSLHQRRYARACLIVFEETQDYRCVEESLIPQFEALRDRFTALNATRYINLETLDTPVMQSLTREESESTYAGKFTVFNEYEPTESNNPDIGDPCYYTAGGWVNYTPDFDQTDAVLLAYRDANTQQDIGFRAAPLIPEFATPEAILSIESQDSSNVNEIRGWQTSLSTENIPETACQISAWAFDSETRQVIKLESEFDLCSS